MNGTKYGRSTEQLQCAPGELIMREISEYEKFWTPDPLNHFDRV